MKMCFAVLAGSLILGGCATDRIGPYTPLDEQLSRDTMLAERLTREGAAEIDTDLPAAEQLLRDALTADLYHGPAHNNLGVVFLKKGKLYEAANEFEWARKLMPGNPDPRLNLGLVLEKAGRVDEALKTYSTALEVTPEYVPALQAIARLTLRIGRKDDRLQTMMDTIAMRGETDAWRDWARQQQARGR